MSDKPLPFVITDRRKFNADGETRPDADPSPAREPRPETLTEMPGAPSQPASSFEVGFISGLLCSALVSMRCY